jgi:hypothetical protein
VGSFIIEWKEIYSKIQESGFYHCPLCDYESNCSLLQTVLVVLVFFFLRVKHLILGRPVPTLSLGY